MFDEEFELCVFVCMFDDEFDCVFDDEFWLCCMLDDDLSCDLPRCPSRGTPADWMSPDPAVHPTPHWPRCRTLTSSQTRHLKWQLNDRLSFIVSIRYILLLKYNDMKIFKYYTRFNHCEDANLLKCILVSVEIFHLLKQISETFGCMP